MIELGRRKGELAIDLPRLVGGCALVQGTRGSGKSYIVRVIAEQTIPAGLQTLVLDPEGEFHLIGDDGHNLVATDSGIASLGDYSPLPTGGAELIEAWRGEVGGGGMHEIPTEARAKFLCQTAEARGTCSFTAIVVEELAEAVAKYRDVEAMRVELVQLAACVVKWIEAIDLDTPAHPGEGSAE